MSLPRNLPQEPVAPQDAELSLPEYCTYTNITLPRPFPGPTAATRTPSPCPLSSAQTGVPKSMGAFTLHGQKRQSPIRNEDGVVAFDLMLDTSRFPVPGGFKLLTRSLRESVDTSQCNPPEVKVWPEENSSQSQWHTRYGPPPSGQRPGRYIVRVAAIMDGHGGSNSATGSVPASPGALVTALAIRLLPEFLDLLLHLDTSLFGSDLLPCRGSGLAQGWYGGAYEDVIQHALAHFRDFFNAYLVARRPSYIPIEVLEEAGCTISFIIRLSPSSTFAVNVGDSSMVAIDPTSDPPTALHLWHTDAVEQPYCRLQRDSRQAVRPHFPPSTPREDKRYTPSVLTGSYEDTISKHPVTCFDSQTRFLQFHDVACLDRFLKEKKGTPIGSERLLVVPTTGHRLRLINSIANLHHHRAGAFVPRTTVYRFATYSLPRSTTFLLMTDGVREKLRDTPGMAAVANALATGPEACEKLIRLWSLNGGIWRPKSPTQRSSTIPPAFPSIDASDEPFRTTPSPPRRKHIRASHLVSLLMDVSRGFSPFQNVSPRSDLAVHRLAQLFAMPVKEEQHDTLRLAESLVQLALLRASVDDMTCLAWRLLDDDKPEPAKDDQVEASRMDVDTPENGGSSSEASDQPNILWIAATATALHHVHLDQEVYQPESPASVEQSPVSEHAPVSEDSTSP